MLPHFTDSTLALVFIILSFFWYSWLLYTRKPSSSSSLPGPRGVPILGYLPFLKPDLHRQFHTLAKRYGPIFGINLGRKLCVVISSPELIKEIVRDNDAVFANRDAPISALIATGGKDIAWSPNDVYWREVRKLFVNQVLSNRSLQSSYSLRREEVRKTVRELSSQVGKPVRIGEVIFATEVEVVMSLLWGPNLGAEKWKELRKNFIRKSTELVDLLGKPNVSDFFPILARFDVQGIAKEMRVVVSEVEEIFDFVIEEKKKKKVAKAQNGDDDDKAKDVLDALLDLLGQEIGDDLCFGVQQIKALLLDMMTGGTDTSATIIEWVMMELLGHPKAMDKVVEELMEVVGIDGIVEEFHLDKLHYLEAAIREAFRLHPPVPMLVPRSPSRSCAIGGYEVPAGSRIFLNIWSVQTDDRLWDNASEFRPERFLEDNSTKFDYMGNNFQFLPFGSGRRVCPGLPLAERMVMHFIATLVHSFEWRVPEGEKIDITETFGIVMRKKVPLVAVPYRRSQSMNVYE